MHSGLCVLQLYEWIKSEINSSQHTPEVTKLAAKSPSKSAVRVAGGRCITDEGQQTYDRVMDALDKVVKEYTPLVSDPQVRMKNMCVWVMWCDENVEHLPVEKYLFRYFVFLQNQVMK